MAVIFAATGKHGVRVVHLGIAHDASNSNLQRDVQVVRAQVVTGALCQVGDVIVPFEEDMCAEISLFWFSIFIFIDISHNVQNIQTSKFRNVETSKRPNVKTSKKSEGSEVMLQAATGKSFKHVTSCHRQVL